MRKLPKLITSKHHNETSNTTFHARIYNDKLMTNHTTSAPTLGDVIVDPAGQKYMVASTYSYQQGQIISYDIQRLHHLTLDILRQTPTDTDFYGRSANDVIIISDYTPCIQFSAERGLVTIQPDIPVKTGDLIAIDNVVCFIVVRVGLLPSGLQLVRFLDFHP